MRYSLELEPASLGDAKGELRECSDGEFILRSPEHEAQISAAHAATLVLPENVGPTQVCKICEAVFCWLLLDGQTPS